MRTAQLGIADGPGPEDVLRFWLEETPARERFVASEALDAEITRRFRASRDVLAGGGLGHWLCGRRGTLAYVILADQFPRNMFRDDPRSYATDATARAAAASAIDRGFDRRLPAGERFFLYLPFTHSEMLPDQERAVRLMQMRLPDDEAALLHARAHREVIRRFGRFPHRNAALGRRSSPAEVAFLEAGGYGAVVRDLQGAAAA